MHSRWKNILLIFILFVSSIVSIQPAFAGQDIIGAEDIIQSTAGNLSNVTHSVTFTLPLGSTVNPTDYINLTMSNYLSIDISNISISGNFVYGDGTGLHVTFSNKTIQLSNISLLGGNTLSINTFKATDPAIAPQFNELLTVSSDQAQTAIKNQATIVPQLFNNKILATSTVLPFAALVTLQGYAFPGAFLTISENQGVIGTTSPDGTGFFQANLSGLSPGSHNFTIFGIDSNNSTTAVTTLSSIYTPAYVNTTITNIILSPIVRLPTTQIQQGDPLPIHGEAVPNSTITISINSPLVQYSTTSDSAGNFSFTVTDTSNLFPGDYQVSAIATTQNNIQSISSLAQNFTVLSPNSLPTGQQPCGDISRGDLNCDGHVDILDFSILMYYWGTTNPIADIAGDGNVDLLGFSIMMYYFET